MICHIDVKLDEKKKTLNEIQYELDRFKINNLNNI